MPTDLQARTQGPRDLADLTARTMDFDSIPLIDIASLTRADAATRVAVALDIRRACEQIGFFYVTNHGVPQSLEREAYRAAKEFFALPTDEKLAVDITKSDRHRGYCAPGTLSSDINTPDAVDLQEAYEVSLDLPADDEDYLKGNPMYGPNLWPERPAGFRVAVSDYVDEMVRLGRTLFRGFALALDLDEGWFEDKITKPMGQLRLVRYPPQTGPIDPKKLGVGAHTDYECFTILSQSAAGLQVQNCAGAWLSAPPIAGALVINIGDCMARWTNDRFRSTLHRVINRTVDDRYSLVFFYGANYHTTVECLPTCQSAAAPPKYPPVSAGDWTVRNIQAAYAYQPKRV